MTVKEFVLPEARNVTWGAYPDHTLYHILTGVNIGSSSFEGGAEIPETRQSTPATLLEQVDLEDRTAGKCIVDLVSGMQAELMKKRTLIAYYTTDVNLVKAAYAADNAEILRLSVNHLLDSIYNE